VFDQLHASIRPESTGVPAEELVEADAASRPRRRCLESVWRTSPGTEHGEAVLALEVPLATVRKSHPHAARCHSELSADYADHVWLIGKPELGSRGLPAQSSPRSMSSIAGVDGDGAGGSALTEPRSV
jgi:hypothetical protein